MIKYFLFFLLTGFLSGGSASDTFFSTGHSGTGANIDVKYHRFEWNLNPDLPKRIQGNVTTYFIPTENKVGKITFDLNKQSYDNENLIVKYHGQTIKHSFPKSGYTDILTIDLPKEIKKDVLDSVTIFYNGVPPAVDGEAEGCQQTDVAGYPILFTLSESYEDKDWWPCKADMQDKIDSLTFIFHTPAKYTPAANGRLISTTTNGDQKTTVYKHHYPIASYLVGIAVAQYNIFDRGTVNIGGTEMPVMYYVSKGHEVGDKELQAMDATKTLLVLFSNLFGDYPFKNEKYGMYEFGWGGGMEHQTFSAMGWGAMRSYGTIAHELMHQWFGDKVSFATWNHLWLAEGFASYGSLLANELTGNTEAIIRQRRGMKRSSNGQLKDVGCYIPDSNITNSNAIWQSKYGSSVYQRGAMVLSMLRTVMGDSNYFRACREYLNDPKLAYASATTSDLQKHFEKVLGGYSLAGIFDSYVYGNGYPIYGVDGKGQPIEWQDAGNGKILFQVGASAKSDGSTVASYSSVLPLHVKGANGEEKLIVLYDQGPKGIAIGGDGIGKSQMGPIEVKIGFTPVSVDFDPYNMTLAEGVVEEGVKRG